MNTRFLMYFLLLTVMFSGCSGRQERDSSSQTINSDNSVQSMQGSPEYDREESNRQYEKYMQEMENNLRNIADTSYLNHYNDTLVLEGQVCSFSPEIMVVTAGSLRLVNTTFDSVCDIHLPLDVQTAAWSTIDPELLYVLLKNPRSWPDTLVSDKKYFAKIPRFDLKLYKLHLDDLLLTSVTTLYDNSLPVISHTYEMSNYFPGSSTLQIREEDKHICYDFLSIMLDFDYHLNYARAEINLKTGKTSIIPPDEVLPSLDFGRQGIVLSNAYDQKNNYLARRTGENILLYHLPGISDSILIPGALFMDNEQIEVSGIPEDSILTDLQFGFTFTRDSLFLVGSPYTVHEMGVQEGDIYLIERNTGKYRVLLEGRVLGYNADLFFLDHQINLIRSYWEVQVFDSLFRPTLRFPRTQHLEIRPENYTLR